MYGPNFRGNLNAWLQSIPNFPKPFDMSFIPLSEILKRLSKSFLDQDCKKQCESAQLNQKVVEMPDGSWEASTDSTDFYIKVENNHFDYRDPAVRTKDFCIEQCKAKVIYFHLYVNPSIFDQ